MGSKSDKQPFLFDPKKALYPCYFCGQGLDPKATFLTPNWHFWTILVFILGSNGVKKWQGLTPTWPQLDPKPLYPFGRSLRSLLGLRPALGLVDTDRLIVVYWGYGAATRSSPPMGSSAPTIKKHRDILAESQRPALGTRTWGWKYATLKNYLPVNEWPQVAFFNTFFVAWRKRSVYDKVRVSTYNLTRGRLRSFSFCPIDFMLMA